MNKYEYVKMYELEDSHFWFVGKRLFIDTVLHDYKRKIAKILDVGAGTGGIAKYLEKYAPVQAVEKNKTALKFSRLRGVNIKEGNAESLDYPDKSFDLVTILDVLYHKNILNERCVLDNARRVLKKGGYLLITDSAFNFLRSYHDSATHGNKRYTLEQMNKLVESSKFSVIKGSYIYFSIFPFILTKRMIDRIIKKHNSSDVQNVPWLVNNLLILILKMEACLLKHFSFPVGSSIIILAQKSE